MPATTGKINSTPAKTSTVRKEILESWLLLLAVYVHPWGYYESCNRSHNGWCLWRGKLWSGKVNWVSYILTSVQVCHTFRLSHNGKSVDLKGLKVSSLLVELSCGLMCVDPLIDGGSFVCFFSSFLCLYLGNGNLLRHPFRAVSSVNLVSFS